MSKATRPAITVRGIGSWVKSQQPDAIIHDNAGSGLTYSCTVARYARHLGYAEARVYIGDGVYYVEHRPGRGYIPRRYTLTPAVQKLVATLDSDVDPPGTAARVREVMGW